MFMSPLNALLSKLTGALLIALLAYFGGYQQGGQAATAKAQAKQAIAAQKARDAYDAQAKQAEAASAQYLAADRALATQFNVLTEQFHALRRTTPLLVFTGARPACAVLPRLPPASSQSGQASSAIDGPPHPSAAAAIAPNYPPNHPPSLGDADAGSGLALSAGAVWLWNSALTGVDTPAHSCGAIDPTAPACAAGTSLTVDAAFDNHITNAQLCAANRLAHQQLIDFIHKRQNSAHSAQQQFPNQAHD